MNSVKTKLRNRMQFDMIDSILCTRYGLTLRGEHCHSFTVTQEMLSRFNVNMYHDDDMNSDRAAAEDEVYQCLQYSS